MHMQLVELLPEITDSDEETFFTYLSRNIGEGEDPRQYLKEYWFRKDPRFEVKTAEDRLLQFHMHDIAAGILNGTTIALQAIMEMSDQRLMQVIWDYSLIDNQTISDPRPMPYDLPNMQDVIRQTVKLHSEISTQPGIGPISLGFTTVYPFIISQFSAVMQPAFLANYFVEKMEVPGDVAIDLGCFIHANLDFAVS